MSLLYVTCNKHSSKILVFERRQSQDSALRKTALIPGSGSRGLQLQVL